MPTITLHGYSAMESHCAANADPLAAYSAGTQGAPDELYTTASEMNSAFTRTVYGSPVNGTQYYLYTPTYVDPSTSGSLTILFGDSNNPPGTMTDGMLIDENSFGGTNMAPGNGEIFYLRLFNTTSQGQTNENNICLQHNGQTQQVSGTTHYEMNFVTAANDPICLTDTCDILTPNGYVNVKDLSVDDYIISHNGARVKITKIMKPTTHVAMGKALPHFIPKNSLGENKPTKDTFISKNHAYKSGDEWICGQFNIGHNATNWGQDFVTYYNIMTEDYPKHSLVVNGVEMESWGGYERNKPETYVNIKLRKEKLGFK